MDVAILTEDPKHQNVASALNLNSTTFIDEIPCISLLRLAFVQFSKNSFAAAVLLLCWRLRYNTNIQHESSIAFLKFFKKTLEKRYK